MTDVIQTVVHLWRLTHRRSAERWKHNIWCCWGESALVSHGEPFQSVSVNIQLLCKASTEFMHRVQPEHNKVQQDLPSSGVHSHLLCVAALLLLKCVAVERHASEISTCGWLNGAVFTPRGLCGFLSQFAAQHWLPLSQEIKPTLTSERVLLLLCGETSRKWERSSGGFRVQWTHQVHKQLPAAALLCDL